MAAAVALSAFVVGLPEWSGLVVERIALGQIVIVYLLALLKGGETDAVMHPVHVAASTAVGVLACVLALLFPYPRLASYEVKQKCKLFAENASERLKLFVKAFCAEDHASALSSIAQAKRFAVAGAKLHHSVKRRQGSMQWERLPLKMFKPCYKNPGERLQCIQMPLRGMEIALTSSPSFPVRIMDGELKQGLVLLEEHLSLTLKQLELQCSSPSDSSTVPESTAENVVKSLQNFQTIPPTHKELPYFFFLFCMKLLHSESMAKPFSSCLQPNSVGKNEGVDDSGKQKGSFLEGVSSIWSMKVDRSRLMPALKCSLSLGLAVLFGMIYSKENGFWAGLPVAITFSSAREATFKVANLKVQGTVLGTVYGVLGCFVFERFVKLWFISLFPWFIFTSFLQRSQIYGQAGGLSAVISAVLILGRKNFGSPSEFAIARIVETFIGLSCSVLVDIALQPTRASTLAKVQLSKCLEALHDCICSISLCASKSNLEENHKVLKSHLNELGKFIGEAEVEPNFLFLPLHSAAYSRLLVSLSKMADLLVHVAHALRFLEQETSKPEASWKDAVDKVDGDLKPFKEMLASLIKSFEEVASIKSLPALEKELEEKNISYDLEMGKSPTTNLSRLAGSGNREDEMEKMISCYLQNSKEIVEGVEGEEVRSLMVLSLSGLGFCMSGLMRETREIEQGIKDIVQWENHSSHVNLYEISCKAHALYN
ncbi:hypothetical protein CK203_007342 [Vitis vinifera]|uniref:Integral membrane bound transporter domain-containing protein n=1 Tax=Vitis vinifera TaxID=29760 RepID=A0A438G1Q8_VITVI|nr:hypothetical protein CK203_007342 [Vitis vinifera]